MENQTNMQRFCKSIRVLVSNVNSSETDSLKMRYITNFYDRMPRKGYLNIDLDDALEALIKGMADIKLFRDRQMYMLIPYYLSNKESKWIPEYIDNPVHYEFPGFDVNNELKDRNIFVCDETFQY